MFFNLFFFIGMLGVNILTIPGIGPFKSISNISNLYPTSITPPNWTFSIWGVIYFGLLLFSILQFCPKLGIGDYASKISCNFIMSCIFNIAWLLVFSLGNKYSILASLFIILFLLITLMNIQTKGKFFKVNNCCKIIFFDIPFSLYLGWIIFASFANLGTCFKAWDVYDSKSLFFVSTILTFIINTLNLFLNNNYVTMIVFMYICGSLIVKYNNNNDLYEDSAIVLASLSFLFV